MKRLIQLASAALILGALSPWEPRATGDASRYSTTRRVVNVGIIACSALNVSANGQALGSENPDPHVFFVADSRNDLKPFGFEFVNPHAPPVLTGDVLDRWRRRIRPGFTDPAFDAANPLSQAFRYGQRVTKNMGAYWEANIDTLSEDDLRQYDVLYLHSHVTDLAFTTAQREKLRRFVDGGGTLWVETCGRMAFSPAAPFLLDIQFQSGGLGNAGAVIGSTNHPLLTYPYVLTPAEVQNFGDKRVNNYFVYQPYAVPGDLSSYAAGAGNDAVNPPGREFLTPVVWNTRGLGPGANNTPNPSWRPYILAGQVGAGRMVFSCQDAGCAINDYIGGANAGYGGNSGAISGESLIAAHPADLKFIYNLSNWASAHQTANANARRTGSSAERISSVLEEKWSAAQTTGGAAKVGGAAVYRGASFAVDGDLILHAYDTKPSSDLDGDGNSDDGLPDAIGGAPRDEIWQFDLKTFYTGPADQAGASMPTIIDFFDAEFVNRAAPNGLINYAQRELVIVTLSDGTIAAFRAFPRTLRPNASGQIVPALAPVSAADWVVRQPAMQYPIDCSPRIGAPFPDFGPLKDMPVPSVNFTDGVVFAGITTAAGGKVVAIDPRNGLSAMRPGANGYTGQSFDTTAIPKAAGANPMIGSPTVGVVRDNSSGALDTMVFLKTSRLGNAPESIRSFWFGTREEPLRPTGAGNTFNTRALTPWLLYDNPDVNISLRPHVRYTFTDPATGLNAKRELNYVSGGGMPAPGLNQYAVRWQSGQPVQVIIGNVQAPGGPSVLPNDARNTFTADYVLDWAPQAANIPAPAARSVMNVPDATNTGNVIGGAPLLASNDLIYYTANTYQSMASNNGRGVLFAVNEQNGNQSRAKWTYAMHNGFNLTVNGNTVVIPGRLRQLDAGIAAATGTPIGTYISDVQFTGTPAYKNGVVYAVARGLVAAQAVTVLCAFKADPTMTITLNIPIAPNSQVRLWQVNVVNSQDVGRPQRVELQKDRDFTVDYANGVIHLNAMSAPNSVVNFASASMPFVLQLPNQPEQLIAGTQVDTLPSGREVRLVGPKGVDNLLWYVVLPAASAIPAQFSNSGANVQLGYASSSPLVQGDLVWLGFQGGPPNQAAQGGGAVASIDADPSLRNPEFQAIGAQVNAFPNAILKQAGHLRWAQVVSRALAGGAVPPVLDAPPATNDLMMANSAAGSVTFEDAHTVVAEGKRLIEVNSGGEAVWAAEGTRTYTIAGGELPQYVPGVGGGVVPSNPAAATGVPVVRTVPFANPTVVRRINLNDLLVVDTGNNRVVQIDRGGNTMWEVNRLFDNIGNGGAGYLRPGDPTNLNEPTDCQYWQEFTPNLAVASTLDGVTYSYSGPAWIIHYLIADAGNFRVIELVDCYDLAGRIITPANGNTPAPFSLFRQVNFVSNTFAATGKRYRYRTSQRILVRNGDLPQAWRDPNKAAGDYVRLTLAAVSNYRQVGDAATGNAVNAGGDRSESTGGSIVLLGENGVALSVVSNIRVPDATVPAGYRLQPIVNPTSFTKFDEVINNTLVFKYLLSDANGCYQLVPNPNDPSFLDVEWMLSADDYYQMSGKRLYAASIRRLQGSANNVLLPTLRQFLITNSFRGEDNPSVFGISYNVTGNPANGNIVGRSAFTGEVFVINPSTFNWLMPGHGYQRDYVNAGNNTLISNTAASITRRIPSEQLPVTGTVGFIRRVIGDPQRATSTQVLEQPSFADRPF